MSTRSASLVSCLCLPVWLAMSVSASGCGTPEPDSVTTMGVYASDVSGFDTKSYFVDTGKEIVVFDAQFTPALAQQAIAAIRQKSSSPIKYVVVTHPNPDKFNGASAFQELGAKVVASAATARAIPSVHAYKKYYFVNVAKMFTEDSYPKESRIDVTFSGTYELPLSAGKIALHELVNGGVSTVQTVAEVPAIAGLFVGDLVHHKAHAWLEGGIVEGQPRPDLSAWKQSLKELLPYSGFTVYGGRGESANVETAVTEQTQYLNDLEVLVRAYVGALGPAAKTELSGPNAGSHYKKIAEQAMAKYPQYTLPYMIEYGVYGLVNQIAGL